ncbi:hypothetical protein VIGAN_03126200 [Vigna angularis var. angularis]|uniref:Uncharacterized protein n=1 Tax=Vigna angularis var. angularis TaxID=157739 RepID=A0A0S3RLY9_PHAAN|nr:hypothetical protein VIGAN_03126200 [Vigna angularis var. angularis]
MYMKLGFRVPFPLFNFSALFSHRLLYLVGADYFHSHSTRSLEAKVFCVVFQYLFHNPLVLGAHWNNYIQFSTEVLIFYVGSAFFRRLDNLGCAIFDCDEPTDL